MSPRVVYIASNTFREAVRDRVLYNLIAFALLMVGASVLVAQISIDIERNVVVIVTDIRGYTALTEGLEPRVLVEQVLNRYFTAMTEVLYRHGETPKDFLPEWVSFSNDGRRLAMSGQAIHDNSRPQHIQLWKVAQLRPAAAATVERAFVTPQNDISRAPLTVFSPDGMKLAFATTRDSTVVLWRLDTLGQPKLLINKEVYVMNADGTSQVRLTNMMGNDDSPVWAPDGTKIVFRSDRDRNCCDPSEQVWVMNVDGSGQRKVTGAAPVALGGDPRVSPDGSRILFISNRTGIYQLYVMRANGSRVRQLTNGLSGSFLGNWSPDGRRIVYYSDSDGQIVII